MMKGVDNSGNNCRIEPVKEGDIACEIFLEILVIAAAGVLSSSLTTATIYDCLVGTSI